MTHCVSDKNSPNHNKKHFSRKKNILESVCVCVSVYQKSLSQELLHILLVSSISLGHLFQFYHSYSGQFDLDLKYFMQAQVTSSSSYFWTSCPSVTFSFLDGSVNIPFTFLL